MWKKIGSVHSGDDKSNRSVRSRSRDEFPTQSFHDSVQKMKDNNFQVIDNQNTYFCHNHVQKRKRSDGNRSLSRIKTERQDVQDMLKTTIYQKKHISSKNHDQNQSMISMQQKPDEHNHDYNHHPGNNQNSNTNQKLRRITKPSQLKEIRQQHNKLKQFVKFQIVSFKKAFQDVKNELKFQINYKRQMTDKSQIQAAHNNLVPIVPYRFKSTILDSMNLKPQQNNKNQKKNISYNVNISNQTQLLGRIRNQAAIFLQKTNQEYQNQKNTILSKYADINLEELLA